MLLTITYEGKDTQNLGYLLHKNPYRPQAFDLSYGKAYVFYPELSDERTTAALLLDIDPIDLARGKLGSKEGGLFDYVNDRPYASTSFLSTAISRVFGTALGGRCEKKPELVKERLHLTAHLSALRDNGDISLAKDLFEPLGYTIIAERGTLDSLFPDWGDSPYIGLTLVGEVTLSELLNHLYVLIPVFDKQKHYYSNEAEVQKLLDHGKGWLSTHPYKEKIVNRYFAVRKKYTQVALNALTEELEEESETETSGDALPLEKKERRLSLNKMRLQAVKDAVISSGASSVIDMGCGEGKLVAMLLKEPSIQKILAFDVSPSVLEKAAINLRCDKMDPKTKERLALFQGSIIYRDKRFEGIDCATVVEVIEHLDSSRILAFERVLFEFARPKTVILTTPNREYNAKYEGLSEGDFRHGDHRFEWTREEFKRWAESICERFGYSVAITGIGEEDELLGCPTQMGVFTKNG